MAIMGIGVVTQKNCYRCHQTVLSTTNETPSGKSRYCWN